MTEGNGARPPPDYGTDGWRTVQALALAGAAAAAGGTLSFWLRPYFNQVLVSFAFLVGLILGCILLSFAGGLWWTTKHWKPIELARLSNTVQLGGGELVLDIGCGLGQFSNIVAKRLSTGLVVGIDLWAGRGGEEGLVGMRRNSGLEGTLQRVEAVRADLTCIPFRGGAFDVVISGLAPSWLSGSNSREGLIDGALEKLREGGRIALLVAGQSGQYARHLKARKMVDVRTSYFRLGVLFPSSSVTARKPFKSDD